MSEYVLSMEGIVKRFGVTTVVDGVNLNVQKGETVAIIGPSGAGKSTLLRCVNHLEIIQSGRIAVCGEEFVHTDDKGRARYLPEAELRRIRSQTAMVFQHFNLFAHLTCLQNVTITGIKVRREPAADVTSRALALLQSVGLSDKADAYPAQLSGGQKQRVAIARALALQPKIMLFDEPTSALDPEIIGEVLAVIRALASQHMTMLIVTHEIGFAREVADRIVFMDKGRIAEEGPPELLSAPRSDRLRAFLSAIL